jgi:hypothetical protein
MTDLTTAPAEGTPTPAPPEGKTFTQADLDRIVEDRLGRERKKYEGFEELKARAARADELEAQNQSEIEKAQGKLTKAEQRAAEAEAKLLRYEVAQEKDVPAKLVPLLTATDKEGLEAQANLILENAKPGEQPPPEFDGGPREPAPPAKAPAEEHNSLVTALFGGAQTE